MISNPSPTTPKQPRSAKIIPFPSPIPHAPPRPAHDALSPPPPAGTNRQAPAACLLLIAISVASYFLRRQLLVISR
jgi:hypothetical protein